MALDLESLSLTEMIRLRETLSEVLMRRFERTLAVAFTDVVGSTAYFAEFGDEAGRGLQQRHYDLLAGVLPAHQGRIVDTAGDGAFTCFPTADNAVQSLAELQRHIQAQNLTRPPQHRLMIRAAVHSGPVLTDGVVVSGDAVNLCARITSTAQPGEIRLSKAAFLEVSSSHRVECTTLPPVELKGIAKPVEIMLYRWHHQGPAPTWVLIQESGERIRLPQKPVITFGRLREHHGVIANDVVLVPPNPDHALFISRWHFELKHQIDGMVISSVSDQATEVDGQPLARGHSAAVKVGTIVTLANVLHLVFQGEDQEKAEESERHTRMFSVPVKLEGIDF